MASNEAVIIVSKIIIVTIKKSKPELFLSIEKVQNKCKKA